MSKEHLPGGDAVSDALVELARSGDREAFDALVAPHRLELQVHCYRMLGSLQDAEDVVQESLLAAWVGMDGFEGRSGVRTWLYRIATNRCLNHLRATTRRPVAALPSGVPAPSSMSELTWLQPFPDLLLDGLPDELPGPEARYESREAITLAFISATQRLQPRQRAVLILRDVLGYPARDTAQILGIPLVAVNNDVTRARATLARGDVGTSRTPTPPTPDEDALVEKFVEAFVAFDVDAMVGLMSEDVWLRMPPLPFEYHGRAAAHQFFTVVAARRRSAPTVVPTRANDQPAWGDYRPDPVTGLLHLTGIEVLTVAEGLVTELTRFEGTVAPWFGLPRTLHP
jgi:RNA polymerase sigma-70 factor (TIGR02960 family)